MKKLIVALSAISTLALTGCVTTQGNMMSGQGNMSQPQYQQNNNSRYGKVLNVKEYVTQQTDNNALAIAGGALVGGLLGNQVGRGTGNTIATVAGAGAGAYAANQYTKKAQNVAMVELQIRDDNGTVFTVNQNKNGNYYQGQRVIITMQGANTALITPY